MHRPKTYYLKALGNTSQCTLYSTAIVMCPNCYALERINQVGNLTARTVNNRDLDIMVVPRYHMICEDCHYVGDWIPVDECISKAVSYFNTKGYQTVMSCSGHEGDTDDHAFIKFVKPYTFRNLPEDWYMENGVFLRCDRPSSDNFAILTDYARSL